MTDGLASSQSIALVYRGFSPQSTRSTQRELTEFEVTINCNIGVYFRFPDSVIL